MVLAQGRTITESIEREILMEICSKSGQESIQESNLFIKDSMDTKLHFDSQLTTGKK